MLWTDCRFSASLQPQTAPPSAQVNNNPTRQLETKINSSIQTDHCKTDIEIISETTIILVNDQDKTQQNKMMHLCRVAWPHGHLCASLMELVPSKLAIQKAKN